MLIKVITKFISKSYNLRSKFLRLSFFWLNCF